jgi:hypothetical protein
METLKVGIREFRDKLASYLLETDVPVAITRHWDTRSSPAPPGDQIRSACPWLRWPSRSAPPALDPWPRSLAARSSYCLHHRQQCPRKFRIKSSPHQQAPAILQPDFDPRVAHYVGRGLRHLHFHESGRHVFPQPFLPPEEMRRAQLPLSAERCHTLPTLHLFGNQPAPLRPCISASFSLRHRATLLCDDHLPQDAVHVALTVERSLVVVDLQRLSDSLKASSVMTPVGQSFPPT